MGIFDRGGFSLRGDDDEDGDGDEDGDRNRTFDTMSERSD